MRRWFLSYNSKDIAFAEALGAALRGSDPHSTIFFAPKNLRAGGYWLPTLAEEIGNADAFVMFIGPNGTGPWQVLEYYEALDKQVKSPDFPVLLVLLDGNSAPGLPFLRQLHWIITKDPTSGETLARIKDAAAGAEARPGELWRHTAPYRGLAAMTEADTDFFFGRGRETVETLTAIAEGPDRLTVIVGNSGVGKSSLAQAGVLGALKRQAWPENGAASSPWPHRFADSRRWCFLKLTPGADPLKAVVAAFLDTWQFGATDPERIKHQNGWFELLHNGRAGLGDLLDATQRRYEELGQPKPAAFFLYVDQGEELYVRGEQSQRRRFSELIAAGAGDKRLLAMMSLRADFFGSLQNDAALYAVHRQINVPPLRETALMEVVSRPAELLSARFEIDHLAGDIARRAAEESVKDVGALPLLSYLLDDMWRKMVERDEPVLRLPPAAMELGAVLVGRADAFLAHHPQSEETLRRLLTLKLATVREDGEPARRRALRSEFSDDEWRLVTELADHPNRLLVTATPETSEAYVEVAHEAIFKRWQRLAEWIAQEREFLIWKSALEASRRSYEATPDDQKAQAGLMGLSLTQASNWLARRAPDIPAAEKGFIILSRKAAQRRRMQFQALVGVLAVAVAVGLAAWWQQEWIKQSLYWLTDVRGQVLTVAEEQALEPGATFRECTDCLEMVVVPAGEFMMGWHDDDSIFAYVNEKPWHEVTIPTAFAVSKFEVTFAEWDACGDCMPVSDSGWGRGRQPVINVTWADAQQYVAWLSRTTGKPYRLLSEAEWEYAARAGSDAAYSWGPEIGEGNANCSGCGSRWDDRGRTAPAGSFAANAFGLYDMHGNVWEWVEDCWHDDYNGAPEDGASWEENGDCSIRVVRGGGWSGGPDALAAAARTRGYASERDQGFRVGRTLSARADAITVAPGAH